MRKRTWQAVLCLVLATLAACSGQNAAAPTNAQPTAPALRPTTAAQSTAAPNKAVDLTSVTWQWTQTVGQDGSATTNANPDQFRIQFQPGGNRVSIATACQSATGTYTTNGQALKIVLEGMSGAVCPGDNLSAVFIGDIAAAESYSFDGGDLVLKLQFGGGTLRLAPKS